jgi:ubiquinone/menaquinone biosynthesis C-methylase UbiE
VKDPRTRFTETVENYRRYRPDYPAALFRWIAAETGVRKGARVVDLACGTGISSRPLAQRGYRVTGVDPNRAMLRAAAHEGGGVRYVRGSAEKTGLRTGSAALLTVAQAFHWFRVTPALREIRRVLAPGGWCVAYWNRRKKTPLLIAYERLLQRYSREYGRAMKDKSWMELLRSRREMTERKEGSFPHRQRMDRAGFFGRVYSASYVVHGVRDRAGLDRELGALFWRHARRGRVTFDYETYAIAFRL